MLKITTNCTIMINGSISVEEVNTHDISISEKSTVPTTTNNKGTMTFNNTVLTIDGTNEISDPDIYANLIKVANEGFKGLFKGMFQSNKNYNTGSNK